jgi:hypothetical protein
MKERNAVGVGNIFVELTQGSSCVATLGFEAESLWDSWAAALMNSGVCLRLSMTMPPDIRWTTELLRDVLVAFECRE